MDFRTFWDRYPRKVARQAAEKAFKRLSLKDSDDAFNALELHLAQWRQKDRQFIPHAATWIRGRRWEDEIEISDTGKRLGPGDPGYYDSLKAEA